MQTTHSPLTRSGSAVSGQTLGWPETGASFPDAPSITITETALGKIVEAKAKLGLPVKGLRVLANPRSPIRADFALRFVPTEEAESPTDSIQSFDGIDLYVASDVAPYLERATIDFVFSLVGSQFKVAAPVRKLDTPEGRLATEIQQILDAEVVPSLAMHGGGAVLIDVSDGVVFLELTGGCQGCSMATATMKNGIETSIRERFPEILEVRDVTNHAAGMNPFAQ